jgi:predicted phage baseplate assembly protein
MSGRFSDGWWCRESTPLDEIHLQDPDPRGIATPLLLQSDRKTILANLRARITAFTPDWRPPPRGDAGTALLQLASELIEPVTQRVDKLPDKQLRELLRTAGIVPAPPTPAQAELEITVAKAASQSVLVPRGFQVGARPADGQSALVIFETQTDLWATPGKIAELQLQEDLRFFSMPTDGIITPFGGRPKLGNALYIGIDGDSAPRPELSIAFELLVPAEAPPPVPAGGVVPLPTGPVPFLAWEVLDGNQFVRAEIVDDQTGNLLRSGIVTVKTPPSWTPSLPAGMSGNTQLRWLRIRLAAGAFAAAPKLTFVKLNVVLAMAVRTLFNEVLQPAPDGGGRRFLLSQVPVLPGSAIITVDEGSLDGAPSTPWREVDDLLSWGPDARVFELDPGSGQVTFGDGLHGVAVPPGFRNVVAERYQTGGGATGAVDAQAISSLLSSVPFVSAATNPLPASGGSDEEPVQKTLLRGPEELRARGRAVTLADYELLALRAPGASVARAHAASGLHPSLPGAPIPGVVGVLVVPPARGVGPYLPDEETLRAVAQYLSSAVAPAGITVVAGAPRYHVARIDAEIVVEPAVDEGAAVAQVLDVVDGYLDPLIGGDDGEGWPFGGTIRYARLVRRILEVTVASARAIAAVPRLSLIVDGLRVPLCSDRAIPAHDLVWPGSHQIIPVSK